MIKYKKKIKNIYRFTVNIGKMTMEMKFKIFHNGELSGGLAALKEYFPFISADGIELAAVRTDNLIRAEKRKGKITVEYSDLPSFF